MRFGEVVSVLARTTSDLEATHSSPFFGKTCKNPKLLNEVPHCYGEELGQSNARPELNLLILSTILIVMISCVYEFSDVTY
jgi:hypothetical protein